MKMSNLFPSKWLQASDLNGKDWPLTVQDVQIESVGNPPEPRPAVYFHGTEKALILNKTNTNSIVKMYGDDSEYWAGRQITLFPTQTDFGGKTVPCIRVRLELPSTKAPPQDRDLNDDLDDEIPF